jgi:hypothetical protein
MAVKELLNFKVKITAAANEAYGEWRVGKHDDLLLGLAVACARSGTWAARRLREAWRGYTMTASFTTIAQSTMPLAYNQRPYASISIAYRTEVHITVFYIRHREKTLFVKSPYTRLGMVSTWLNEPEET